jgi:hypothetical protein
VQRRCTYVRLNDWTLTALPWKKKRLLLGRPLLVVAYRTTLKSTWPLKPVSGKLSFRICASSVRTDAVLELSPMYFYFGRWSTQITGIQLNRYSRFGGDGHFMFCGPFEGSWSGHRRGMNKLLSTEYEQTPSNRSDIFMITVLSHVYWLYEKVKNIYSNMGVMLVVAEFGGFSSSVLSIRFLYPTRITWRALEVWKEAVAVLSSNSALETEKSSVRLQWNRQHGRDFAFWMQFYG